MSAGELLRTEVAKGSAIGGRIDATLRAGQLVPAEIIVTLLRKAMEQAPLANGFLIDGFPRRLDQAEIFEREVTCCKFVLYLECSEKTLERRLLKRGQSSGRSDDNPDTILKRFRTFTEQSFPVIQDYILKGRCVTVSAELSVDLVFSEVRKHFLKTSLIYQKNIVFVLGAPGSGKGTQCSRLALEYNMIHISTGDILREEVRRGTEIGLSVDSIMREGNLVPLEIVLGLLRRKIKENINAEGFLIGIDVLTFVFYPGLN